jgi:hypothetical protein
MKDSASRRQESEGGFQNFLGMGVVEASEVSGVARTSGIENVRTGKTVEFRASYDFTGMFHGRLLIRIDGADDIDHRNADGAGDIKRPGVDGDEEVEVRKKGGEISQRNRPTGVDGFRAGSENGVGQGSVRGGSYDQHLGVLFLK